MTMPKNSSRAPVSRYRWVILCLAFLCLLVFGFTLQAIPPVLPLAIQDLDLSHAEAGLLMSLFSLPGMLLAIPAGSCSDRWGPSRVGLGSLSLALVGTVVFAASRTFLVAALGRTLAGLGAATTAIVAAQMLSRWFVGGEIGTAMGIYTTAMPVGTIVCFTAFGPLGARFGWRVPVLFAALVTLGGLAAFRVLYRPPPRPGEASPDEAGAAWLCSASLRVGLPMWLLGLCWMWFNAAVISFSTFAPDFLVGRGYGIGAAGSLVSLLMWGTLVLNPAVGRLLDKLGNNESFIGAGGLVTGVAIYLVVSSSGAVVVPMVVLAVGVGLVPAAVFSFPSKLLAPGRSGLAYGILAAASSAGMVLGPLVAGWVRDATGSYQTTFLLLCVISFFTTVTALVLRIKRRTA